MGERYIQHYETIEDGPEAFTRFANEQAASDLKLEIKHIVAEGDLVTLFSHITWRGNARDLASFDMFRVEDGKVVEHWGADKDVPEKTASGHSVF